MWLLPILPLIGFVANGLLSLTSAFHYGPTDPGAGHGDGAHAHAFVATVRTTFRRGRRGIPWRPTIVRWIGAGPISIESGTLRSDNTVYARLNILATPKKTAEAASIARELGTPLLIHQPSYSMLNRWIEKGLLDELEEQGMGCIVFTALAQGLLTDRYLDGIPEDSRAARQRVGVHVQQSRPVDGEQFLHRRIQLEPWPQNGFAGGGLRLGDVSRANDEKVIDGFFVNGSARFIDITAGVLRRTQSGYLYHYAFAMILGLIVLLAMVTRMGHP